MLDTELNKYIEKVKINIKHMSVFSRDLHALFSLSEMNEHPKYLVKNTEMRRYSNNRDNLEARFQYRPIQSRELVIVIEGVLHPEFGTLYKAEMATNSFL